jgi:hypothetical protein
MELVAPNWADRSLVGHLAVARSTNGDAPIGPPSMGGACGTTNSIR